MKDSFCKGYIKVHNPSLNFKGSGLLDVEVANRSDQNWESEGPNRVKICYHWMDENWNMVVYDGFRTEMAPDGVAANTSAIFAAQINPPDKPGVYYLTLTLLRESIYWFDGAKDFTTDTMKIRFAPNAGPDGDKEGEVAGPENKADLNFDANDSPRMENAVGVTVRSALSLVPGSDFICVKPFDKTRKIGFMHIPKTSGSAMITLLTKALDIKTYFKEPDHCTYSYLPNAVDPVLRPGEDYLGHMSLNSVLKGCPEGQYLTVFREASNRILSLWLFWRNAASEYVAGTSPWHDLLIRTKGRLNDILVDPEFACAFDNASLRYLVWPDKRIPKAGFIDKKDDEGLLQLALERLKQFSFLDVVENPRFETNLQEWLGTGISYARENVTQIMPKHLRSPLHHEFSPEALDALDSRSRLDRALWTAVATARLPGVDVERLARDTLIKSIARYSAMMS